MKILFLDFDGVLNSQASFILERRMRKKDPTIEHGVGSTLCHICTSNLQYIIEKTPDLKIVISSSWRRGNTLDELKEILASYGVDSSIVIDVTPYTFDDIEGNYRGNDIKAWLEKHHEVTQFVILDDDSDMEPFMSNLVQTSWNTGLTYDHVMKVIFKFKGETDEFTKSN